ncbi:MAG: hypothetical protein A2W90_14395 [Bacteroidetes bacterium GWF2_42_66]|nr:MAG: hypothetical protein A2W92_15790 [Bacteroidetes bacterium GWA2_42_15]OFX99114.1 MAG: hypothetical protein A2W89_06865 [Bacteroidetes bacterium GWE2_42_39]OFY46717.1 MAG: hypothetical protein A2W90_14395 [Bacteroidetes bacterium GWF2_42_66]HBL73878.1 hypothetical protein [Prolixibacteraceae bacterium]HCU63189.1 hypothetical protein [Prolixibacteraceae bacterium]
MKKFILILFVLVQLVCRAEYDSTYVLSVAQKYAIPEDVSNGDHVGTWLKTWTWASVGTVSYSMEQNFDNAFSINSSSGLITITDESKINGKVVQQDTLINLIIRTTDSGVGYELDTARIWVKENGYCKFVDFSAGSNGDGTKASPYNDLDDITWQTACGYFLKRGTVKYAEHTNISTHIASTVHPTIIGAYGQGRKPVFDGTGGLSGSECFYFGSSSNQTNGRCENIYMYDIEIFDYTFTAIKYNRESRSIGFYNIYLHNNDKNGREGQMAINTASLNDTTNYCKFEFINCEFDTSGVNVSDGASHVKIGVSPAIVTNSRFGVCNGTPLRFAGGNFGAFLRHSTVDSGILNTASYGKYNTVQLRDHNSIIEDCRLLNSSTGIMMTSPTGEYYMHPDYVTIKNCYFSGQGFAAIFMHKNVSEDNISVGHIYEDNKIVTNSIGIRYNKAKDLTIRRNLIVGYGAATNGITNLTQDINPDIYYNVVQGFGTNGIYLTVGSGAELYNNTVDGTIDCTGASSEIARNNFHKALTSVATESNNIDIDGIETANYFQDYVGHNYMLKPTAIEAIDKGHNVSPNPDIAGTSIPQGVAPDIGAYEYKAGATSNLQIQRNDQKGIKIYPNPATGIVHIRFDNLTENIYQSEWLKIIDLHGRQVFQKTLSTFFKEDQGEIDLSGIPKGLYLICFGNRMMGKLVLK